MVAYTMTQPSHATWLCLVEMAALRRDAVAFASLLQIIPHAGRMACRNDVQYQYWARFFDSVDVRLYDSVHDYNKLPLVQIEYRRCGRLHRDHGLPALESLDGMCWYNHGTFLEHSLTKRGILKNCMNFVSGVGGPVFTT